MTVFGKDGAEQRRVVLAILSGALLFISFPKFGNALFAWFALVPLFYALEGEGPKESFRTGFLAGMVGNVGIFYWITFVVVHYGGLPLCVGVAVMLLLAAYLSIYTALFAAGLACFHRRSSGSFLVAPALWVLLEFIRSIVFTGFPWENLGYSQYQNLNIIQIADVAGVYGVSFVVVFVNRLVFEMLEKRRRGKPFFRTALVALAVLAPVFIYGHCRIADIRDALNGAPSLGVSLVQGNIDQNSKWDPQYQSETVDIYERLSIGRLPEPDGIILWPETAAPFFFDRPGPLREKIMALAATADRSVLFGSPYYEQEGHTIHYMNSAFLVNRDGTVAGRYDKVHLVPYGEYVPLKQLFPFIGKLVEGIGDFRSGDDYIPLSDGRRRYGVLICYEGIFPEGARAYKNRGADVLANVTNDAWFGATSAPYQHLSMTVFRAVETRLFLLRAANTGVSAIIDPTGSIQSRTGLFERDVLRGSVKFIDKKTFYAAYGEIFVYICLIMLVAYEIKERRRRRDERRN